MPSLYRNNFKQIFDTYISLTALFFLSPIFLILALTVKYSSKGPIFFIQTRMGQHGIPFQLYKFRSMVQNAEKLGPSVTNSNDSRITPIGKFLRNTKLDELPQLLNVIKGDMALVGPRPEVEKYTKLFQKDYAEILKIKPGITDLAAIKFRNEEELLATVENIEHTYITTILPQKIILYNHYSRTLSFRNDILIIFKTIFTCIKG